MNIISNYQLRSFNYGVMDSNKQSLQTNPSFGIAEKVAKQAIPVVATAVTAAATTVLAMQNGKVNNEKQEAQTDYGKVVYNKGTNGEKPSLDVTRKNGMQVKLFENISQEVLESPVITHMHQVKPHTVNPKVIVFHLVQNESAPIQARKIVTDGTVQDCMAENNLKEVPMQFDVEKDNPYIHAPYTGKQYITGNAVLARYGTTKWGTEDYNKEFLDPKTGEAPDIAVVADQKRSVDHSMMPADIADRQYDIVEPDGTRKHCKYDEMEAGVDYMFSKRAGVKLGGFVTPEEVTSSEDEKLPASKFVMVDSLNHCYDSNPIDRILKGDVTWLADMNDPAQAKIKNMIDEIFRLKDESGKAGKAGNDELAKQLSQQAKELTNQTKQEAAAWVEAAQKATGVEYFI